MVRAPGSTLFFFNDTATTEIYTLSLHDALPIFSGGTHTLQAGVSFSGAGFSRVSGGTTTVAGDGTEAHIAEVQGPLDLVGALLVAQKFHLNGRAVVPTRWRLPHPSARRPHPTPH